MYRPVDASMLERAGYGLTQRRIRLLEGKFDKTQEEQDELIYILERNEKFLEYKRSIVPELAKLLGVEEYQIYRVPNKKIYEFIKLIHSVVDNDMGFLSTISLVGNKIIFGDIL